MTPYPNMGPHEVAEKVQAGYRMPQPVHVSNDMYVYVHSKQHWLLLWGWIPQITLLELN